MAETNSIGALAAPEPKLSKPHGNTGQIGQQLTALVRMTASELRQKYAEVFGETSRSNHREWLIKRIAWRLQANSEGGLSERARLRALELANDADLRMKAPPTPKPVPQVELRPVERPASGTNDHRLPQAGAVLKREYKGRTLIVTVLTEGFQLEGQVYKSLSAVAKAVTGTHTNGYLFFRLGQYGGAQ